MRPRLLKQEVARSTSRSNDGEELVVPASDLLPELLLEEEAEGFGVGQRLEYVIDKDDFEVHTATIVSVEERGVLRLKPDGGDEDSWFLALANSTMLFSNWLGSNKRPQGPFAQELGRHDQRYG